MWSALVAGVLGVLGLVANAEWFAGRWARSRRRIRADAELLERLPAGIGQRLLRARVDDAALTYVLQRDTAIPTAIEKRFWSWAAIGLIGVAVTIAGQIGQFASLGTWSIWFAWSGVGVMALATIRMRGVSRQRQKWFDTERRTEHAALLEKYRAGYLRVLEEETRTRDPESAPAPALNISPEFPGDLESPEDPETVE